MRQNRTIALPLTLLLLIIVQLACSAPIGLGNVESTQETFPTQVLPFEDDPTSEGFCPANGASAIASGLITSVTLAKGTEGDLKTPVDPTDQFAPADTIHAVVAIQEAPEGTQFKASWWAIDIGDPSACNMLITEYEVTGSGTRNIDFTLTADDVWPAGSYKVEIYVNGTLDQVLLYMVQ